MYKAELANFEEVNAGEDTPKSDFGSNENENDEIETITIRKEKNWIVELVINHVAKKMFIQRCFFDSETHEWVTESWEECNNTYHFIK